MDNPRYKDLQNVNAVDWADRMMGVQVVSDVLFNEFNSKLEESFKGITVDGDAKTNLFNHQADDMIDISPIVKAARNVQSECSKDELARVSHGIDAIEWRSWSNPEIYFRKVGLRLETLSETLRMRIMDLIRASLSERGYKKLVNCMRINHFLGELDHCPGILNQYSYNFSLFGDPSLKGPWGWQCFGHHMVINCCFVNGYQVLTPTFIGAEPNWIDEGDWKGTTLLQEEASYGLSLMQSFSPEQQKKAVIFREMKDPSNDRWNPFDERHLAGAFQDNRIIPYEGLCMKDVNDEKREALLHLISEFICLLPSQQMLQKLNEVRTHLDETYFAWIGGHGDDDVFYYRIQSPVIIIEFDMHCGIWLTNAVRIFSASRSYSIDSQKVPHSHNSPYSEWQRLCKSLDPSTQWFCKLRMLQLCHVLYQLAISYHKLPSFSALIATLTKF